MSGGGGGQTATTKTGLPSYDLGAAKKYLGALLGQALPGGQLQQYDPSLNQSVAPFTGPQSSAFSLAQGQVPGAQGLANLGANANAFYASGMANDPSTNPNLQAYANAAAIPLVTNYAQSVAPGLAAQAQQSGTFNSSGYNQALSNAQQNLAQGLATQQANIFEPAFQLGTQEQMAAIQGMPGQVQGLFAPSAALYGIGSAQQQQQQNQLNAATQNAQQRINFPYSILQQLGAGILTAGGGGGTSVSTTTPGGGK